MTKKIFLTSAFAMCMIAPAIAEPSHTGEFPAGGLMQADYTYTNAATSTNMAGVYEGSVNANAQYSDNYYTVSSGTYLPADSEAVATCTAGNYCPGLQSQVLYSENSAQGLNACPSGYTSSDSGASVSTQCYRSCVNSDISHATGITGNVYYNGTNGDGTKECTPTSCDSGWHLSTGAPDLDDIFGFDGAVSSYYIELNGDDSMNYYGLTDNGEFVVDFNDTWNDDYRGVIHGYARCSTQSANGSATFNTLPDSAGTNCYCMLDGYTPYGGTMQSLSTPWVFLYGGHSDAEACANECAGTCAAYLHADETPALEYRAEVFATVSSSGSASCVANIITINWGDTDSEDITANNAGTATYGSDIRTPVKAQTKKGKTFTGWTFSAPTGN